MGKGARHFCPRCTRIHRGRCTPGRNYKDERQRLLILAQYRREVGDWCLGTPWCDTPDQPHETPDITVDHRIPQAQGGTLDQGWDVMCRTANSRRQEKKHP